MEAKTRLGNIQCDISANGAMDQNLAAEASAHAELELVLTQQEIFLKERSQNKWLEAGDRNTSFFHRSTAIKNSRAGIHCLMTNGDLSLDNSEIASHISQYFEAMFSESHEVVTNSDFIREVVPSLVQQADNNELTRIPSDA